MLVVWSVLMLPFGYLHEIAGVGNPNTGQARVTVMPTLTLGISAGFTPPLQSKMRDDTSIKQVSYDSYYCTCRCRVGIELPYSTCSISLIYP